MADALKTVLSLLAPPPPPAINDDYDGWEFRWKFLTFRPAYFVTEAILAAVIFAYLVFHLAGKSINVRKAERWLDVHLPVYETQFSRPTTAGLIRDGNSDFFNFSTGRRNVVTLHTIFTLRPRHDVFQALFHTLRSWVDVHLRPTDELQLDFKLQSNAVPNEFVFAVVNKDELPWIKTDRWDLTLTRTTESQALPPQLVLNAEFADISESLFKLPAFKNFIDLLRNPANLKYFKSLSITDLPRIRPTGPIPVEEKEKHLVLSLKVPSASRSSATVELVTAIFDVIDNLNKLSLRPETKNKLKKAREDLSATLKKDLEKEKEEQVGDKKKLDKKKAEEEKIAKLSAAEQQKYLERERKRSQRKQQGKVSIRK